MKQVKPKKCRACKAKFQPRNSLQVACSPRCALEIARANKLKRDRKEIKEAKQRIKTKAEWLREAQAAFNAFVRIRDDKEPCISCQRFHSGKYDAGHYRTTKAAPQLRFNLWNNHKQCQPCNRHLSGNITEYRINLVKKIGAERVDWIESNNESKPYSIEYARRAKKIFSKRTRLYKKLFR